MINPVTSAQAKYAAEVAQQAQRQRPKEHVAPPVEDKVSLSTVRAKTDHNGNNK